MSPNDALSRSEQMHALQTIAAEYPALIKELVQTYSAEELTILTKSAIRQVTVADKAVSQATDYLAKSVGLEEGELSVQVVLSPSDSDLWDAAVAAT